MKISTTASKKTTAYFNEPKGLHYSDGTIISPMDVDARAALTKIVIDDSVKLIEDEAFTSCSSITDIVLPSNLEAVGTKAFHGCDKLKQIVFKKVPDFIGKDAFSDIDKDHNVVDIYISSSDLSAWCTKQTPYTLMPFTNYFLYVDDELLVELTIPEDVTAVRAYAFMGCWSIRSLIVPSTVKTLGYSSFSDTALTDVSILSIECDLEDYVFCRCDSLQVVKLAAAIPVYPDTFQASYLLKRIEISGNGITSLNIIKTNYRDYLDKVFVTIDEIEYNNLTALKLDSSATEAVLVDGTEEIADGFARNCYRLTTVSFPRTLKRIGFNAFENCWSIESVDLSNCIGLIAIDSKAFACCYSLEKVIFPRLYTDVAEDAFIHCYGLPQNF